MQAIRQLVSISRSRFFRSMVSMLIARWCFVGS
jgi:hypothetical protein